VAVSFLFLLETTSCEELYDTLIPTIVGGVTAAGALLALLESLLSAGDSADTPE